MTRTIQTFFVVVALIASTTVFASGKYKPVVVYEIEGNASLETKRILVENLSNALRRAAQRIIAIQSTGNGTRSLEIPNRGDLAVYRDLVFSMDKEIQKSMVEINRNESISPDEHVSMTVELLWTSRELDSESDANILNSLGPQFKLIAPLFAAGSVVEKLPVDISEGVYAFNMSDVPGGIDNMYFEGYSVYDAFAKAGEGEWLPIYSYSKFDFLDKALTVKSEVNLKPSAFSKTDFPEDPDAKKRVKSIIYKPSNKRRWVSKLEVIRKYNGETISDSFLVAKFGYMIIGDVRSLAYCAIGTGTSSECLKDINSYPTITVETRYGGLMGYGAWFLGLKEFQILVKKVTIDLNTQKVIPSMTELPIATENFWGYPTIIDKGAAQNPLNLFQAIRLSQLGDQIEGDISEKVKEAIDAFNNSAIDLF